MRAILAALAIAALAVPAAAQTPAIGQRAPVARVGDQRIPFPVGGQARQLPAFANRALAGRHDRVRRVVIVLHGALRDADVYLEGMVAAAAAAGALDETLIVAPQFLADVDAAAHTLDATLAWWTIESWKDGRPAAHPTGGDPVASSSFAALDAAVSALADRERFPALARVVLAGHSAGGQVLARYTPTNRADPVLRAAGMEIRYVISSPSSYLYFDDRRPTPDGGFAPFAGASCPGFDDYKYGLRNPPPYVAAVPAGEIAKRFLARDVVFLLGGSDNDPAHRLLDRSCPAMAQGRDRLSRGLAYTAYLRTLPGDAAAHHRLLVVPGVGHNNRSMFGSPCGRAALFGDGNC